MLRWTPKSEEDLILIRKHIAENFTFDLAIETVDGLIDYVENTFTSNPLAGSILETNPLFFKLTYRGNSIFYCENPKDKNLYIVYIRPRGTNLSEDRIKNNEVA